MDTEHPFSNHAITFSNEEAYCSFLCDALPAPVQQRALNLLGWYISHSKQNKKCYLLVSIFTVIFPAAITVISAINPFSLGNLVIAILSALTTILVSINSLFRFRENWTRYRRSSEDIKRMLSLFLAESKQGSSSFEIPELSKALEYIAKNENIDWYVSYKKNSKI